MNDHDKKRPEGASISERTLYFPASILVERAKAVLESAGASEPAAAGATRAMLHASLHGIDSHGFRLTDVYCRMIRSEQVNPRPDIKCIRTGPASAMIDADDGLGHYPSYTAMQQACDMAQEAGVGVATVFRSSHNGAAGAYAIVAAEAGYAALSSTNSDSAVALHGGAAAFHGTNPIAAAAPVPGARPWLLDMATSSIPLNRVLLYQVLGRELPPDVAAEDSGEPTTNPTATAMLLPLGGSDFGFKGAALAGLVTILCGALSGATLDHTMPKMSKITGPRERRNCGHFFLAIDPGRFVGREAFGAAMLDYLSGLRGTPAKEGERVMAAGDREWETADRRQISGIPIDTETATYLGL
jgi:ureidoglycolate dehydrogenase (NAD+)